jgi:hypothetical protein
MSELASRYGITPFELFATYHLGVTADDGYRFQNLHDVARRFGCPSGVIKQLLAEFDMDADALVHSSYDMASAQVDIMTAPTGVSRRELAKQIYDDFRAAPRRKRDWRAELEEDARQNERTYGPRRGTDGPTSRGPGTPDGSSAGRGRSRGPRS